MRNTQTQPLAGHLIAEYLGREFIQQKRLMLALGVRKDQLSRMLRHKGRVEGERLTAERVTQIADELAVDRATRQAWLTALTSERTAA